LGKSLRRLHIVSVEMDEFDSVVIKESTEEVSSSKANSTLEERRKHHNFCRIGCRNVFSSSGAPLQYDAIGDKMIHNKFANFVFIHDKRLKKVQMRGGHG
jgi:hypothetical protein